CARGTFSAWSPDYGLDSW
nr:immunoglobulin heavy chain junction region [Macaca mulatta]MOV87350.1 immunoglobulin heavy chain junction region [Macaca mulatta]MOV90582.1 immunoglobulin heavy chain junction region [Macaca mulatta]MOV91052.1 immunoglobulin heavy chain junction region [Macaca mulatta]